MATSYPVRIALSIVDRFTNYRSRYGYPADIAIIAEFWWRIEHVGLSRWWGRATRSLRSVGYAQRKRWERIGYDQKLRREAYERAGQKPVM